MQGAPDKPSREPPVEVRVFTIPSMRPPPEPPGAAYGVNRVFFAVICLWFAALFGLVPLRLIQVDFAVWIFCVGLPVIILFWIIVLISLHDSVDAYQLRTEQRAARIARLRRISESPAARVRLPHRVLEFDLLAISSVAVGTWKAAVARLPARAVVLIGKRPSEWYFADRSPVYSEPIGLGTDSGALWELARQRRLMTLRPPPWEGDLPSDATPEQSKVAMREWMRRNAPPRTWAGWVAEVLAVLSFISVALGCVGSGAAAVGGCLWFSVIEATRGRPTLALVALGVVGFFLLPKRGRRNRVVVLPGGIATAFEWPWSLPREVKLYTPERNALAVDCECGAMLVASGDRVDAVQGGMNSALILLWCSPQARPSVAAISQYFGGAPVREVG